MVEINGGLASAGSARPGGHPVSLGSRSKERDSVMTTKGYRRAGVVQILIGIVIFIILLGTICTLSTLVKRAGNALLYVPGWLGLVHRVTPAEVEELDLTSSPVMARFDHAGAYQVYTSDYDLLNISMLMEEGSAAKPWLKIVPEGSNTSVPIAFVSRGLSPFDSPYAAGRPVLRFELPQPGLYELVFPTRKASIFFVPDEVTGREWFYWLIFAVEAFIVLFLPGRYIIRRIVRERSDFDEHRRTQRARADAFWLREEHRRQAEESEQDMLGDRRD